MCQIVLVQPVAQLAGSPAVLSTITIRGTATDCDSVDVKARCRSPRDSVFASVPVVDGEFVLVIDRTTVPNLNALDCDGCDGHIEVTATCVTDPSCSARYAGPMTCDCPTQVLVNATVSPCNPDGTRDVELVATHLDSASPLARWSSGHGQQSATFPLLGNIIHLQVFTYPAGAYTATLEIDGCPNQQVSFVVGPCPVTTTTTTTPEVDPPPPTTTTTTTTSRPRPTTPPPPVRQLPQTPLPQVRVLA